MKTGADLIRHCKHTEIDKKKWNDCVAQSVNILPYGFSWWLDTVSPGWEALVAHDYEAVMPLTRNRKLGFDYLYQPFFTQQLGIFARKEEDLKNTQEFLDSIPADFRFIDIQLNSMNLPARSEFEMTAHTNYTLDLTPDYISLSTAYHRNCRRNIEKAVHAGLIVKQGPGPSVFTHFVKRNLDNQLKLKGQSLFRIMSEITQASLQYSCGDIRGVYKPNGEMLAAGWFVYTPERCLFLVCASTSEGKRNQAMYLLVDHVIRSKSGSGLIFDFTGSNIPGVAYFNSGFGAVKSYYPTVKRNNLPWPVRMFKR